MISTLPTDCLNKIFECLEKDKATLHSCLLVNRLCCRISVEILWRNIWDFKCIDQIMRTLIDCLPNESKDLLINNGVTSIPISNPPLFNYVSFCKVLSIPHLLIGYCTYIEILTKDPKNYLIIQEILKMFMKQISSLKKMDFCFFEDDYDYYYSFYEKYNFLNFINFPGANDCLKNLSELICDSYINSEFFLQLSKICHNINSLVIKFEETVSVVGIKDLIFCQNNLKSISFTCNNGRDIFDNDILNCFKASTKHSNTLTELFLYGISLPSTFTKIIFSNLRALKLVFSINVDTLIKFLVNNGKNLEELSVFRCDNNSLNLAIANYCQNLKSLYIHFPSNGIEELKMIFVNCQQLESIITSCGYTHLSGKRLLELVAKYSPKNFHELKLREANLNSKDHLESFFSSWKDRIPLKPFSLIINGNGKDPLNNNIIRKLVEKYKGLGVIKKFENSNK
ncbi:uncharacterized protein OCT59_019261 [Rhizophagus irregularis]|uniref:F-box domain-containing protein n=1 Tax=Rhizophagus irregularis (strain DAOM 197198w) TaxID=1432141 RepID=A0A015ICA5_RHIIW|nr:hypothetical protein RirG_231300 [Rhizophagus irregularis DAOM 197198w]UZO27052.1 hypothetical protein OCT59_019261 [Rhizophagus irregularis]GBC33803.1 hypothetical protein GLOIN_2v1784405 [Rhizophagus irregularis DAOM 181602=DAOM 197198]